MISMKEILYLVTTKDELELPVFVSNYLKEVAKFTGNTVGSLSSQLSRTGSLKYYKVFKVVV